MSGLYGGDAMGGVVQIGTAIKFSNASDHLYREFDSGLDAPGFGLSATIELRF